MRCDSCNSYMNYVVEFPGNRRLGTFWADWCPECKVVKFTGAWRDVPDMPSAKCPEEYEIYEYERALRRAAKNENKEDKSV